MLAASGVERLGPTSWADLGCGDGTFTLALAELLADGSVIHAVDLDASALSAIPSRVEQVLRDLRERDLPTAGLGRVPIRVTESGWPTDTIADPWRRRPKP